MTRSLLIASVTVLFAFSRCAVHAAVFERDWQTTGDGLLTYDDLNRREWLDVSQSLLIQFPGATLEERYQNAITELAPGGLFEGFTVAVSADVIGLAQSAGIDTTTSNYAINGGPVSQLIDLLHTTFGALPGIARSQGMIDEFDTFPPRPARSAMILHHDPPNYASLLIGADSEGNVAARTGVMLYRSVIPEPDSLCIGIGFVFGLFGVTRHRRRQSTC
jgi:hypothetical protein